MRRILFLSAISFLALVLVAGGAAAYFILGSQDRGVSRDGRLAPPASVRNAPEAPKFDAARNDAPVKTAAQPPEYQLPTDLKLPTELDIAAPKVPGDLARPADATKS
jgi:hypothetical protein